MKKVLGMVIAIVIGLFIIPNVQAESMVASITNNSGSHEYSTIKDALDALQDGDTIKFLSEVKDSVYGSSDSNKKVTIEKNVTVDLNNKKLYLPFVIAEGKNVTLLNGGPDRISNLSKELFTIEDGAQLTISGGSYTFGTALSMIKLGSNAKLVVDGAKLDSSYVLNFAGNNSTLEINNSTINGSSRTFKVTGNGNTATVSGGVFNGSHGIFQFESTDASDNTFTFTGIDDFGDKMEIKGNRNTVNFVDTHYRADRTAYAVEMYGTDNKFTVSGNSIIEAGYGAIYMDSDTASVIVDGGTIQTYDEDTNYYRLTPVIFAKQAKEITVNGGTIVGQVGIVALDGNVNINGGTITSNNTDDEKYVVYYNKDYDNPIKNFNSGIDFYGAAVIADGTDTKVNITGGEFNATTDEAIVSVENATFTVSGGIYNKNFDPTFVVPGKVELTITNGEDQKWYVGQDALDAVDEAKTDVENEIEVLQGDLIIEDAIEGLKVTNTGDGKVYVNEVEVPSGKTVVALKTPEKPVPENPNTSDCILNIVLIALLSIGGMITTLLIRKSVYNH